MKRTSFLGILVVLGASVLVGITVFLLTSPSGFGISLRQILELPLQADTAKTSPSPTTKVPPTAIRIAKLDKSLPVIAALVQDNEWDLFDDKVSWLSTSAVPGEGENVILYAHNTPEMFGELYKLEKGDTIEVQQNDIWTKYVVRESRKVTPKDVEAVLSEENQLTLYTCEGSFNQKRRVVYAEPKDY